MSDLALFALMALQRRARDLRCRLLAEQHGEGVISAAIAAEH